MKNKTILAALMFFATPASAALIETSTPFGADTGVLDTDQNLVFVDFGQTANFTYDSLLTSLATGGMLDGYRLANISQLNSFFDNAGLVRPTGPAAVAAFRDFGRLIDTSPTDDDGTGQLLGYHAITADVSPTMGMPLASLSAPAPFAGLRRGEDEGFFKEPDPASDIFRNVEENFFNADEPLSDLGFGEVGQPKVNGFALVIDAPTADVPAPGAWLLFGLAVLGVGLRRRYLGQTRIKKTRSQ